MKIESYFGSLRSLARFGPQNHVSSCSDMNEFTKMNEIYEPLFRFQSARALHRAGRANCRATSASKSIVIAAVRHSRPRPYRAAGVSKQFRQCAVYCGCGGFNFISSVFSSSVDVEVLPERLIILCDNLNRIVPCGMGGIFAMPSSLECSSYSIRIFLPNFALERPLTNLTTTLAFSTGLPARGLHLDSQRGHIGCQHWQREGDRKN